MLEVLFWVVQMCAVHTCRTAQAGPTAIITICAPPNKPVPENQLHSYRTTFKEEATGKVVVIQIQNCVGV